MVRFNYIWNKAFRMFLILLVFALPLSPFFTSIGIIGATAAWFFLWNWREKIKRFVGSSDLWLFLGIYFLHIIGLLYSSDFRYAIQDLKVKLPLLILPLVLVTSPPLLYSERRIILVSFISGVIVSSLVSVFVLLTPGRLAGEDIRQIALFVSHIRLSLMVNLAIYGAFYLGLSAEKKREKYLCFIAGIWLIVFLFLLKSFTGLVVFLVCLFVLIPLYQHRIAHSVLRRCIVSASILLPVFFLIYVAVAVKRYYSNDKPDPRTIAYFTAGGRPYCHDFRSKDTENGHFVWLYLCEEELRIAWPLRSRIAYDSLDLRGNPLRFTLIRYLTSRGMPKDSLSVMQLSDDEIKSIENGVANYLYRNKVALYPYIYRIFWEFDSYVRGNNPSGHSITQRIIYWQTAVKIIRGNWIIGVGTGDVQQTFNEIYEKENVNLNRKFWLRAHNQYLTFLVTFGLPGFLIVMAGLVIPCLRKVKYNHFLKAVFLMISFLSMLPEDTLETQAGVTFVAFFYSFFILANRE